MSTTTLTPHTAVVAAAVIVCIMVAPTEGSVLSVSNVVPRRDIDGNLFDAHDGSTQRFEPNGSFYYHAMRYGECIEDGVGTNGCGQLSNNSVGVWQSPNLTSGSWKLLSSFTPSASGWPNCTYYRSHALFSHSTNRYVLWINAQSGRDNECTACPMGSQAKCFVAGTSTTPHGPFVYAGVVSDIRFQDEGGVGDFSLFQDDDVNKTAYVIYKRSGAAPKGFGHRMTLQQLEPDILRGVNTSEASAGIFGAPFVEAPAMFKRKGIYYSLFGQCCAFCAHGTGIGVYTAAHPLGPWATHTNIGCDEQSLKLDCGCGLPLPPVYNLTCPKNGQSVTFAQQNSVIVTGSGDFIWTGDRWQSACAATVMSQGLPATGIPNDLDCVKAFDLQYWSTLRWSDKNENETENENDNENENENLPRPLPLPLQLQWENKIDFTV